MGSLPVRGLRVDGLLSRYGYCSRREAPRWARAGRVTRGGVAMRDPSERVLPSEVLVDGQPVEAPEGLLVMFHKPLGVVCSRDEREGPSVFGLLPARWSERNPPIATIGRLDKDTTGLLFVTDAGELVHRWTSPKHHVEKIYEVGYEGQPRPGLEALFASGTMRLEGEERLCLPARLEFLSPGQARLTLVEGRFHQVRRMFAAVGLNVIRLHRPRFGNYELGDLPEGQWRFLPMPGTTGASDDSKPVS